MNICRICLARRLVVRGLVLSQIRRKTTVDEALATLGLQANCSQQQAKDAFVELAKVFHPDSSSSDADQEKFSLISEAYEFVTADIRVRENVDQCEEVTVEEILKGTIPVAHRRYLTNDGIGFGTPSQRHRQYQAYRLNRAESLVSDYKIRKVQRESEDSQLVAVKDFARRSKTTHFIDRVVEDMIQESMAKGEFNDLKGGKVETPNIPYVNQHDFYLNKVLINNGFAPDWIQARQQLERDIEKARDKIFKERKRLHIAQQTRIVQERWKEHCELFRENIANINRDIQSYNLITPVIKTQKMLLDFDREMEKVEMRFKEYTDSEEYMNEITNLQYKSPEETPRGFSDFLKTWLRF